jgi:hypothetical protein
MVHQIQSRWRGAAALDELAPSLDGSSFGGISGSVVILVSLILLPFYVSEQSRLGRTKAVEEFVTRLKGTLKGGIIEVNVTERTDQSRLADRTTTAFSSNNFLFTRGLLRFLREKYAPST